MSQNVCLIGLFRSLGAILLGNIVTLIVAIAVRKEARHISKVLEESNLWLKPSWSEPNENSRRLKGKSNSWKRRAQKS
jgi:hypothetical protein